MKEYRISELMENYTDNEFFVEGEQTVDTEKAVSDLLGQVQPKRKKVKTLFKVMIAAAAAVVLAGAVTAGTLVLSGSFVTPTNLGVSYRPEDDGYYLEVDATDEVMPIKVEEGNRLFFTADGEYTDITDLVDENTPYIYSYVNTEGYTCYVAVGGAAGDYGYFNLYPIGDSGEWNLDGRNTNVPIEERKMIPSGTEFESLEELYKAVNEEKRSFHKAWVLAACDELGLWDVIKCLSEISSYRTVEEFNESLGYVFSGELE